MQLRPIEWNDECSWLRQPCDTESRWRAFQAYRDQPPPRTVRGASEALGGQQKRTLEYWSTECMWPERCEELDRYLEAQRVAVVVDVLKEDARETAAEHIGQLREARDIAVAVVRQWAKKLERGETIEGWSPNDVRQMIRDTITLERLVRGEATERVEHGLVDLSKLSVDDMSELKRLEAKAGAE